MDKNKTTLEVGDVIYRYIWGKIANKYIIDSVTDSKAKSGNQSFYRKINGFEVRNVSGSDHTNSYYLENEKQKREWRKAIVLLKIKKHNFEDCSLEQLEEVLKIIKIED